MTREDAVAAVRLAKVEALETGVHQFVTDDCGVLIASVQATVTRSAEMGEGAVCAFVCLTTEGYELLGRGWSA